MWVSETSFFMETYGCLWANLKDVCGISSVTSLKLTESDSWMLIGSSKTLGALRRAAKSWMLSMLRPDDFDMLMPDFWICSCRSPPRWRNGVWFGEKSAPCWQPSISSATHQFRWWTSQWQTWLIRRSNFDSGPCVMSASPSRLTSNGIINHNAIPRLVVGGSEPPSQTYETHGVYQRIAKPCPAEARCILRPIKGILKACGFHRGH